MQRAARVVGGILLGLVALVSLGVGGAMVFVRTERGGRWLRDQVVPRVNQQIAGNLSVGSLRLRGWRLELRDVRLRTPEGTPVAEVGRLEVVVKLLPLLRRELVVGRLVLERPALTLVSDQRGLNLARAVKSRKTGKPPVKAEASQKEAPLSLDLEQLTVSDGAVSFREGERDVRLVAIGLDGRAAFRGNVHSLDARLLGKGQLREPYRAPLSLAVMAGARGERGTGEVSIELGGSAVKIAAEMPDKRTATIRIKEVAIEPRLVRAFAPQAPGPAEVVRMNGEIRRAGPEVSADVHVRAGRGEIHARGSFDSDAMVARQVRVTGKNLDTSALLRDGPPSRIAFSLEGHGGGRDLESLRGEVRLDVPPSRLGGKPLGPIVAHAQANARGYKLVNLLAELPGVSLRAHGDATRATVDLQGKLVARDLGALAKALQDGHANFGGKGALDLRLTGALTGPTLTASGRFATLQHADQRLDGLEVVASIPDLSRPAAANVRLQATRVRASDRALENVNVTLVSQPENAFAASVRVGAPALSLDAAGRWTPDFSGLTLARFELAYPEARWRLARPASLRFGGGKLTLDDLALEAGPQRIAATVHTTPRRLDAKVVISALDLGRLPRAFLPRELVLAGKLDVDAAVAGSAGRPRGHARITLVDGKFRKLDHLALELDARHDGRRLAGTLAARVEAARASAKFDLPAIWPPAESAPVALDVSVSPFDVPALLVAAGRRPPAGIRGTASMAVKIDGTFGRPEGSLDAQVRGLALRGQALGDAVLAATLQAPAEGLDARVRLRAFGGESDLRAKAPVAAGRLPRLSQAALLKLPVTLAGTVEKLPLGVVAMLGGSSAVKEGTASARIDLHGPVRAPVGTVKLDVVGASGPRFPATDVHLQATAREDVAAKLRVIRRGRDLVTLEATVHAPPARLADVTTLASAPLEVHGHFGPVRLKRSDIPPITLRDHGRTLSGRLEADLRLDGTLRAPRLLVTARADETRFDDKPVGQADLQVKYAEARPELSLVVNAADGGKFELRGSATADLSYPRVLRGVQPRQIPITADLQARNFDLAALSGIVDELRVIGGKLTADAKLRGQAGAPAVNGRVEWRDGQLTLADFGAYQSIHLLVHGDGNDVVLEELAAKGGRGDARLTARATRAGAAYNLTSKARLRSFPVFAAGQPVATISLDGGATGTLSADRVALDTKVTEAHFNLPETKRKHLQDLNRPTDVVLFDGDRPLNKDQTKKLKKLLAERAAEAGADAQAAGEAAAKIPPEKPGRRVRVQVDAPRNLWIEGPDVHFEIGLDPGFLVTVNDELRVFGTVHVQRGRLEVLGKRFDVDPSSTVRFTGPPDRPEVSVKASYEARAASVVIQVALEGPLDRLDLQLSSPENPQYGDTELLTVLATGHLPDEPASTTTPGDQAASILGGVLASRLQKALARRLPLDVLTIEAGGGLSSTRLEAGTYLTDRLYVAYVGRVGADPLRENRNEVQLEYQLSRRWSFEGTYGDARRGSADLVWTKSY